PGGSDVRARNGLAGARARQRRDGICRRGHDRLEGGRRAGADVPPRRCVVGTRGRDPSRLAQRERDPAGDPARDLCRSRRRDGRRLDEADLSKQMTDAHFAARAPPPVPVRAPAMTAGFERLFAAAVSLIVLPLYAPQPLVDLIGPSLGLPPRSASLVAMTPMLGYAAGLVLVVPLIDILENRRAILLTLVADCAALASAAAAPSPALFLLAAFAAGCATSAIPIVVPVAATLAGEPQRGRVIGNIMSGLMIGILLSRPIASLAAAAVGWRGAYVLDAVAVAVAAVALQHVLPWHQPAVGVTYGALVASLGTLLAEQPVLRRRALYQALCMAA